MNIYYFCDQTFLKMKENFVETMKDEFIHNFIFLEKIHLDKNAPGSGVFIWTYKTEMIIKAIKEHLLDNEIIVISDVDIQFFKPVIPTINEYMQNVDMSFQKEWENSGVNIGFMAIRCNKDTLKFWETVYNDLIVSKHWDQGIVNHLLYKTKYDIKWNTFPPTIWTWTQGNLKKDIILHHANSASSQEGKFIQMDAVKSYLNVGKTL